MQSFYRAISRISAHYRLLSALLVMASVIVLAGCGGGGGGGGGSSSGNSVTGTVQNSASADAALTGATVVIGGVTATTDSTGSFTIKNAAIGASTATISAPSQLTQTIAFSPPIGAGTNSPLQLFINIGEISGTVLLPDGTPASGAFVSVSDGDVVSTNANGTFLIVNIPTGVTQLNVVLGTASYTQSVTIGNGVVNVGSIKLVASTNPNPPGLPYDITGQVLIGGADAGPILGAQVFLLSNGSQLETTNTDANGDYSFYVPAGTYTLIYSQTGYVNGNAGPITVSKPSTLLTVPAVTLQSQ